MQTTHLTKAQSKVSTPEDDRRFFDLYKCSLQALLSGESFEVCDPDSNGAYRMDDKEELEMVRHLAWLAYEAATAASEIYRKGRETAAFNQKLGK